MVSLSRRFHLRRFSFHCRSFFCRVTTFGGLWIFRRCLSRGHLNSFRIGRSFDRRRLSRQLPAAIHQLTDLIPQLNVIGKLLGQQIADAGNHLVDGRQTFIDPHVLGRSCSKIDFWRGAAENVFGQRSKSLLPSLLSSRLLSGLKREIGIFHLATGRCLIDDNFQFVGQLPLRLDGLENKRLAFQERSQRNGLPLDQENLLVVESARIVLTKATDERNRVPFVKQLDGSLNLLRW